MTDENLKFDEMILEAAKGIMAASSALVRAANAAQKELIEQGKVARRPLTSSDDGQWSEGLISAARLVAAATHSLVEAAQNLVLGVGTEETLISAARQVAASTAQLLIACKVKSDPNSESGRRLQAAGNAVIKSTDNLVRAAQQAIDMEEEHILKINTSMVDGMAQEINARSEVLKMERQLEEARNRLVAIRQAKYRQRQAAGYTDDSDTDTGNATSTYHYQQKQQQYGYNTPPPDQYSSSSAYGQNSTFTRSALNATPPSPSFHNTSTSTTYQQAAVPPPPRSTFLTGNAIPRPYHGTGSDSNSPVAPHSPLIARETSAFASTGSSTQNSNLEACVKDLHEKTLGRSGLVPFSTFKSSTTTTTKTDESPSKQSNGQNYEGFTARCGD